MTADGERLIQVFSYSVILVKFTIFVLLAVAGVTIDARNPNPCDITPRRVFVNDYSSCAAYFWCNPAGNIASPTGPCDEGFQFNLLAQACIFELICDECPPTGFIAVSDVE